MNAQEIESKKKLENILKFSIEDVRNEITKKKTEKSDIYKAMNYKKLISKKN